MTAESEKEDLIFLINALINEKSLPNKTKLLENLESEFAESEFSDLENMRKLLRSLMNTRLPKPLTKEFLEIQNRFLWAETTKKGIVDVADIPSCANNKRIAIWQGDITCLKADAIVNAANSRALGCFVPCHNCIDNIIHSAAGLELREECFEKIKEFKNVLPIGDAIITKAYNLPSKFILHTVGPKLFSKPTEQDCIKLANCYKSCLSIAEKYSLKSIVFCCISTGEFRFPNEKAAKIATETVCEFLNKNESIEKVVFNVFKERDLKLYDMECNGIGTDSAV